MTRKRTLLVDTNVLVDYCDRTRPAHEDAVALVREVAHGGRAELYVLVSSLKDLYYIMRRSLGNEPLARQAVEVASTKVFLPIDVRTSYASAALASDEPDFEDGIVRAAAEALWADAIVSRDARAFRTSPVRRLDAREARELLAG